MAIEIGVPTGESIEDYGVKLRLNKLLEMYKPNYGDKILDLGCGFGTYTKFFKDLGYSVIGTDVTSEYLKKAKIEHNEIDFLRMTAMRLAFKDNSFDIIYLIEMLEHVPDDEEVLKEAYRILRPGGAMMITVPNKLFPFETHSIKIGKRIIEPPIPFFSWLPQQLRKFFERARIYHTAGIYKLLSKRKFTIITINYIPPVFEGQFFRRSRIAKHFRAASELIFSFRFIKKFSMSIIILAKRRVK